MNAQIGLSRRDLDAPAVPLRAHVMEGICEELEAGNGYTLDSYAEHVTTWVDQDEVRAVVLELIRIEEVSQSRWEHVAGRIAQTDPLLAEALGAILARVRDMRQEFIEEEADNRLDAAKEVA